MIETFDTLIDSFVLDRVGIAEGFLPVALAANLKANLQALFVTKHMKHAGTGNEAVTDHDTAVRGDITYWLDHSHEDVHENDFFHLMDSFVAHLNATCYTGITGYEFHYAMYDEGSFYRRHLDQFRNDAGRQYSMIIYLNDNWQAADGGELCIYQNGLEQHISPTNGKSVFFRSNELEHEVLLTHKPRLSITGWLTN